MDSLRSAIVQLAQIDRSSCSRGELEAARWIAASLHDRGATATIEEEHVHGTYWWPLGITSAAGLLAAVAGGRGRRGLGATLAAAAAAAAADDLTFGARLLRRLLPKRTTANVVAETGDPAASRTLLLVAHHDAAHTGFFFNPRFSGLLGGWDGNPERPPRHPPIMAPIVLAPALVAAGVAAGARRLMLLGAGVCAAIGASLCEVALRRTVPGANDNLTGVAALLGVADALQERPVRGLRVLLLSTGAEEALMEGMDAFARRHFESLDHDQTWVLCVDTLGSPYLVLAEAEGMLRLRRYDPALGALVSDCARGLGIRLQRGFKVRLGTDGYIALRHGFRAAMLCSVDEHGAASNYHWPTDTPERVDYVRLGEAAALCEALVRSMASHPGAHGSPLTLVVPAVQPAQPRSPGAA